MNSDIVIMGSSRASHHYVSNLLSDSLKCSVYNAGTDGEGIIMNYGVLLEITQRYNPKIIIYELTPSFDWVLGDNERYLPRLRHAYNIDGIDSIFWRVNPNERIKMMSQSYRVNSLVTLLIYDNIVADKDTLNGYVPLYNVYKPTNKESESNFESLNNDSIDSLKAEYLAKMINLCKTKQINLIFAISPTLNYSSDFFDYGEKLALENSIYLIDFRKMNTNFNNGELFQDNSHLNNTGAILYSQKVVGEIRKIIPDVSMN